MGKNVKNANMITLDEHIQLKHNLPSPSEPFPCEMCGLVLANFFLLQEHVHEFHPSIHESEVSCKICDIKFNNKLDLEWHVETEHEQNIPCIEEYKCKACAYGALSKEQLEMHIVSTHSFPCKQCNEMFTQNTYLTHLETHTKPKQQMESARCDECNFESSSVKEFVTHLMEGHNTKTVTYTCSFCDYSTVEKEALEEHMENSHEMITVLKGLARNQIYVSQSFDNFKDDILSAFQKINDDHNNIKQELFILRQDLQCKNSEPKSASNTASFEPKTQASRPKATTETLSLETFI